MDLRYAIRVLRKTPGFSLAAVLVLSVGIGVNTAVFTFVNALVLRPLMGRDRPGEVVGVYSRDRTRPDRYRDFSYANYADIRDRNEVFSGAAAFTVGFAGVRDGETTRRTLVSAATGNYFSTLGVELFAGRSFSFEEERPGAGLRVTVVSHDYWKAHGADPALIGKNVWVNAEPFTVIGIAPPGFTGTVAVLAPDLWVPTGAWQFVVNDRMREGDFASLADRRNNALMVVGRLKPGVTQEAAAPSLARLAQDMEREFPGENRSQDLLVRTLPRLTISTAPQSEAGSLGSSAIVMVMAGIVLLVAAMNLANMVLARNAARQKEIAMRLALGAPRWRIVRQLLTEGVLLALLGGVGGLLVAYWTSGVLWASLVALSPIPMRFDPVPDARVLLATLGFCGLSTVVFGLGPAWRFSRMSVSGPLKAQGGEEAHSAGRGRRSTRDLLVAAQLALSVALLTTGGLFMRGAHNAASSDPGYRLDGRALAAIDASLAGYDEAHARVVYGRVIERVRALPGVQSASPSSLVAFGTLYESKGVRPAGSRDAAQQVNAVYAAIGSDYFRTLGLALLRGRDFAAAEERQAGPRVAILDQPLAVRLFGGVDPLGREVELDEEDGQTPARMVVVGVAPGLRQSLWDKSSVAHLYVPSGQAYRSDLYLHIRQAGGGREADLLEAVRRELRAADEKLPVLWIKTMAEHRDTTTTYWAVRVMASIFSAFGGLALLLAVVGVYAVKAYVVARRAREIGIRMALGSTPGAVLRLVVGEGLGVTGAGLAVGFLLAVASGRVVGHVLYQVSPFDPLVFVLAPTVLAAASLVACYLPARRATRVAPIVALRTD